MMMQVYDIPAQPQVITMKDILNNVTDQVTGQLLYIGCFVVIAAIWHLFGGSSRLDERSQNITGAINSMLLVAGLYLIGLYAVAFWGWSPW